MTTFNAVCATVLLLLSIPGFAKALPDAKKIDETSDYFMQQIVKGETSEAYGLISAYVDTNLEQFLDRGEKTSDKMKVVSENAGAPLSYALLKKQGIDNHFYKLTYLVKYRSAALIWELNYYQADKGWHLVDVSFNTNINDLFE